MPENLNISQDRNVLVAKYLTRYIKHNPDKDVWELAEGIGWSRNSIPKILRNAREYGYPIKCERKITDQHWQNTYRLLVHDDEIGEWLDEWFSRMMTTAGIGLRILGRRDTPSVELVRLEGLIENTKSLFYSEAMRDSMLKQVRKNIERLDSLPAGPIEDPDE
jgi:hypothetical protein